MIFATRHIQGELARVTGMEGLRSVAAISAGVLGNTGIDAFELLQALVQKLKPDAVIAIDALASRNLARLGCTVQMSDAGIAPGAGVGNARPQINLETLGVPVVSIGVPTVVDAATLAADLMSSDEDEMEQIKEKIAPRGAQMVVTPREIDLLISRAAKLIAMAINITLNPRFTVEEFLSLV
jgi:spore protease